jgi:hypothetical protein
MSTKFEQLLDFLVNEEMDKANELFHEIVVDKSREIYENLIAEEAEEEEEVDEAMDSEDEEVDESQEDLEDSYTMGEEDEKSEFGDEEDEFGGDAADKFGSEMEPDGEEDHEDQEDQAMLDIKNAIQELEAAFAELEQAQGEENSDMGDEFDTDFDSEEDGEEGDEEGDSEEEMMGKPAFEGRRMTREYTEKVGHNYGGNTQKTDGDDAGAGTGERQSKPSSTKSPISSGKGKPTTGATAGNILGDSGTGKGKNVGTGPDSLNKGIAQVGGEKFAKGMHNVDGAKSGVKTLSKQGSGYPGNNKSAGPVGSGSGDKAGQTSVSSDKPFLKKL